MWTNYLCSTGTYLPTFPLSYLPTNPLMEQYMAFAERFEDLEIWREARRLAGLIYIKFRECKDFGFRKQIQDAAVSAMNNIAEGFERKSRIEFCRFLDIAKGSSGEVRSMLYLAQDIEYLPRDQAHHLIADYESLSKRISSLMCKLKK